MATFTITVVTTPSASGIVKIGSSTNPTSEQEAGATVNILASPASGFRFVSWEIDSVQVSTTASYSFTMPSNDITLTATFEVIPEPDNNEQDSLYDTACPRFLFVKDLQTRYFSGDVADFTSTDYLLLDDEPIGFDGARFRLSRDEFSHGFLYEVSVDSLGFERDHNGHNYLKTELTTNGTDSDIKFVYGFGALDAFTIIYIGKVDMNDYREDEDGEIVNISLREIDFDNLLQTAFDIPQIATPDKNVLLHSKVIPKTIEYQVESDGNLMVTATAFLDSKVGEIVEAVIGVPDAVVKNAPIAGSYASAYLFVNSLREGNSELNNFYSYDFSLNNSLVDTVYQGQQFLGVAEEAGTYNLDIKGTFGLRFFNAGAFSDPYPFQLVVAVTERDGETIVSETIYEPDLVEIGGSVLSSADVFLTFDRQVSVNLDFEQCLYVYYLIDVAGSRFPDYTSTNAAIIEIKKLPFAFDFNAPTIRVEAQTFAPTSVSKFIAPYDLMNSIVSASIDRGGTTVVSDFFDTDGCGEKLFITNGFNVRGGESVNNVEAENTNIKIAPKKLLEMMNAIFCLGYGVEYNVLKEEVLRVEPVNYFYNGGEIASFDNVSDYSKEVDTDKYYNEVEIGFTKYSKQRETDKGNTLDDFHTKHIYQTPIKTNKNKLSIISDLILSGYELEILRRKQFEKDGDNDNSNYNEDESLFGVFVSTVDPFTGDTYSSVSESTNVTILLGVLDSYQVGSAVTYISRAGVSQSRTIKNTSFSGGNTIIEFVEPLQGGIGVGNITITITGTTYINAEKNENFVLSDFLISPETSYNLRISPKRMLQNHALLINGGFFTKPSSSELVFKQGDGNTNLVTAYNESALCRLGDLDRYQVGEGSNIIIGDGLIEQASMQQGNFLFLPIKVSCSVSLGFEQLTEIKKCLRGQGTDPNKNYGYITINTPCGTTEQILPYEIEYNPVEDEAMITGYLKQL